MKAGVLIIDQKLLLLERINYRLYIADLKIDAKYELKRTEGHHYDSNSTYFEIEIAAGKTKRENVETKTRETENYSKIKIHCHL